MGCVIVSKDNTILLSLGYNGNYRGGPNEQDSDVPGDSGFVHSEVNALVKCDYNFHKGKVMYVTHSPCVPCAKLIVNADIEKVVFGETYRDEEGIRLLKRAGVQVVQLVEAGLRYLESVMRRRTDEEVIAALREEWDAKVALLEKAVSAVLKGKVDGKDAELVSADLKVRHKKSRYLYTVVSVGPRDVVLKTPEGKSFLVDKAELEDSYEVDLRKRR